MRKFPVFLQHDANDCGPACLKMISRFYGKNYSLESLRENCFINRQGVSLLGISDAAESVGFRTRGLKLSYEQLRKDILLPCIAHWNQEHFIVVRKVGKDEVEVVDPAFGAISYSRSEFLKCWASTVEDGESLGICLQLQPSPEFYRTADEVINRKNLGFLFKYLKPYSNLLAQIILGVILGAALQVIFPFLFQTVVDKGVIIPNPSLIITILIAQLILVTSRFSLEFIRNWVILHLGARVNIFLVSDFLIRLMRMPIAFFDSKNRGDLLQRVADHKRIEQFLTHTTIELFHSVFTLTIMGFVLALFDLRIFLVFLAGSTLYILWTVRFMKHRRELDQRKFAQLADNQSTLIQLLSGMHEIKLNNCEKRKRWEWEDIQAKLFRINLKGLTLLQKQRAGALVFNQYKDVLILIYAAVLVLNGQMTLGSMVAISYVVGQLSGPVDQLIDFLHSSQDARISLNRLAEIHDREMEISDDRSTISLLDPEQDIHLRNLSFQYEGPNSPFVLKDINLTLPKNRITAIVGTSGSGKTTLVKMLLDFYDPVSGEINVGSINLKNINPAYWRGLCGVVMQDGYLFSESIARNIALSDEQVDKEKLFYASGMANVQEIINALPLGYNTKIGPDGQGLSQGQKQRILIARALYKDPSYLFFDEATNSLDANNEKVIMENLYDYFKGRTVVVVAHRLSTVRNADQIVVLDQGEIIEIGNHEALTRKKGAYYKLVKNQLEMGV